ncbi:MAG: hypothetical protein GY906_18205 [bacterium]|nr:hypothetical protein [bacterium]
MADRETRSNERLADLRLQQVFGEFARPQLSPYFEAKLRQRLARERQYRLMRVCGRVMAFYWLAVALVSAGILYYVPLPAWTDTGTLQTTLMLVLVMTVAPTWLLLRVFKTGLIDTLICTFHPGGSTARQ